MYHKKIDKTNRNEMIDFLNNHFSYWTMNSWNQMKNFANDIKINNIITETPEIKDRLYDLYFSNGITHDNLYSEIDDLLYDFALETGYTVFFNGRSGGYLVIKTDFFDTSFEDYEDDYIKNCVEVVEKFDILCDDIIKTALSYAEEYTDRNKKLENIEMLERKIKDYEDEISRSKVKIEMLKAELE